MSKCNHFWRAVDSTRSQCSKCFEITSPERELKAEIERLRQSLREEQAYTARLRATACSKRGRTRNNPDFADLFEEE